MSDHQALRDWCDKSSDHNWLANTCRNVLDDRDALERRIKELEGEPRMKGRTNRPIDHQALRDWCDKAGDNWIAIECRNVLAERDALERRITPSPSPVVEDVVTKLRIGRAHIDVWVEAYPRKEQS